MTVLTPARSTDQRREALEEANRIRSYRASLKRDVKAGRVTVFRILLDPPAEVLTMKVFGLLMAMPKYGRIKASRAMKCCEISPTLMVGDLTRRQRAHLAYWLGWDG